MQSLETQYNRSHSKLDAIGKAGQDLLAASRVLVIGAGGLGCPCLLYLAGCGPGIIGIADFDVVSATNLHRQVLYTIDDLGKAKAATAAAVVSKHNPFIRVREHELVVNDDNILDLLGEYDVVVDGTDNFEVRYLINDACVYLNKPLVYGAIHQTEGQVTVLNYHESPTLRCLFTEPPPSAAIPSCADIGAYNVITGIVGIMMANEVVKIITSNPGVLAGKLNSFDALTGRSRQFGYKAMEGGRLASLQRFQTEKQPLGISVQALKQILLHREDAKLIDVRSDEERANENIGGLHLPLNQLLEISTDDLKACYEIAPQDTVVVYCQGGSRSAVAANALRQKGYPAAYSLTGGLNLFKLDRLPYISE